MNEMSQLDYRRREPQPQSHALGTLGLWLFLAALTMLFASSLLGYVYIRLAGSSGMSQSSAPQLHFPPLLWASTALVLGVSVAMHQAVQAIALEKHDRFQLWLDLALGLACGFVAVQVPAMYSLLQSHQAAKAGGLHVYALVFTLIMIHALHVVGGIVHLLIVWTKARRNRFDHEHFGPVKHAMMYWHFLDGVWVVMFLTFLTVG
jgi:cytochrome c oxidase subunit 3